MSTVTTFCFALSFFLFLNTQYSGVSKKYLNNLQSIPDNWRPLQNAPQPASPECWSSAGISIAVQHPSFTSVILSHTWMMQDTGGETYPTPPPATSQAATAWALLFLASTFLTTIPLPGTSLPSLLHCISWKQAHEKNIVSGFLFYLRHVFKTMLLFQMNELIHSEVQFLFLNQQSCLCSWCP